MNKTFTFLFGFVLILQDVILFLYSAWCISGVLCTLVLRVQCEEFYFFKESILVVAWASISSAFPLDTAFQVL